MKLNLHATPIPSYNHLSQKNSDNYKDNLISTICCSLTSKNKSVQKFSLHLIPTQHVRPFVFVFSRSEDFKIQQCYMKPKPLCQLLSDNGLPMITLLQMDGR